MRGPNWRSQRSLNFSAREKNFTGTAEERRKQLEAAIRAELETIAVAMMGEQGKALVEKRARLDQ